MDEHRVEIREDTVSLSASSGAGTTYGLLEDHRRQRTFTKYKERMKLLAAFVLVLFIVGGSAAFIALHYKSTEVFHADDAGRALQGISSSSASDNANPNVHLVKSRGRSSSSFDAVAQPQTQPDLQPIISRTPSDDVVVIHKPTGSRVITVQKIDYSSDDVGATGGVNPYNEKAVCDKTLKKIPKTLEQKSTNEKHANFTNPLGVLIEMLECPTFEYFKCTKPATKIELGFKAHLYVRSSPLNFTGYGTKKLTARRGAAELAVFELYHHPPPQNSTSKQEVLKDVMSTAVCVQLKSE